MTFFFDRNHDSDMDISVLPHLSFYGGHVEAYDSKLSGRAHFVGSHS